MGLLLSSGKRDFILDPPLTNAAGFLGFSDEALETVDLSRLGAFITNPVSLRPRTVARPPRKISFPGGFLLHTGHPNPGLSRVLQQHQAHWKDLSCPVIVHFLGQNPSEVQHAVERLEEVEIVSAIELGLQASDAVSVSELVNSAVHGELPVIAHIPLNCSDEIVLAISQSDVSAISFGPPRGSFPGPEGTVVSGRLYGPSLFPHALSRVKDLRDSFEKPLFIGGGVQGQDQIQLLLNEGAQGIQLDSILWTEPERVLLGDAISPATAAK